jgi:hypothetical protein
MAIVTWAEVCLQTWGDLCSISQLFNNKMSTFWGPFYLWSLRFSQQCFWVLEVLLDVRPCLLVQSRRRLERSLILRVQGCEKETGSAWFWRWKHCVLSKLRQLFTIHHGVTSHKAWIIFILLFPSSVSALKKIMIWSRSCNIDHLDLLSPTRAGDVGWEKYDLGERDKVVASSRLICKPLQHSMLFTAY